MFPSIGVWHSVIRKACEAAPGGRLRITILSPLIESTYDGRPSYIAIRVDGDNADRKYQVEVPGIRALLESIPLDTPIWITAAGSRSTATLSAWTDDGERIPQPDADADADAAAPVKAAPAPAPRQTPAPAPGPTPAPERGTIAGDMWTALLEAERMAERFKAHARRPLRPEEVFLAAAIHAQMDGVREVSRRPPPGADPRSGTDT